MQCSTTLHLFPVILQAIITAQYVVYWKGQVSKKDHKMAAYLGSRLHRLLAQQAFLDARWAQWTGGDMSTRTKQSVTLCVGADHTVFKRLLLRVYQVPNAGACPTAPNQCTRHRRKLKPVLHRETSESLSNTLKYRVCTEIWLWFSRLFQDKITSLSTLFKAFYSYLCA